jgi:Zn-dependent protease with chaperone function
MPEASHTRKPFASAARGEAAQLAIGSALTSLRALQLKRVDNWQIPRLSFTRGGKKLGPMDSSNIANPAATPFQGQIQPTEVSGLYKAGLVLVAILMVLLPTVYVGLIGASAYFVYAHAVSHYTWLEAKGGWLVYFGPIVIGMVLVIFMIKPLFARAPKKSAPYSLDPANDPMLFGFIEQICRQVRAPLPKRVDVDCQINASASFRRGWLSLIGHDLVLTIGLPLVGGLNQRQLAGVLAHEFGHFAQGGGMRLTYLIRSVSYWFARVVYERDTWDQSLAEASHKIDIRVGIILYAARFCVWLTRKILWVLMMLGQLISCFMLRQMEFDADSYEAKLAGSDTFASTAKRLQELNVANEIAWGNLRQTWQSQRLPDNLPVFVVGKIAEIPAQVRTDLEKAQAEGKTGWLDTHPCDTERIQRAQALNQSGIFPNENPASQLFRDYAKIAREATVHQYRVLLQDEFRPELLAPTEETLQETASINQGFEAADRIWFGLFNPARPLELAEHQITPLPMPELSRQILCQRRQKMQQAREDIRQAAKQFAELLGKKRLAQFVQDLQSAHFKVEEKVYIIPGKSAAESLATHLTALDQHHLLIHQMAEYETLARERLAAALQLLQTPEMAAESRAMVRILSRFSDILPAAAELDRIGDTLKTLFDGRQSDDAAQKIDPVITELVEKAQRQIAQVDQRLGDLAYPFKHARGNLSIIEYARTDVQHEHMWVKTMLECNAYSERLVQLYWRIIGRLAIIAEQVENQMPA